MTLDKIASVRDDWSTCQEGDPVAQMHLIPNASDIRIGMTLFNGVENTPVFANPAGGIQPVAELGPLNLAVTVMGVSPVESGYVLVMFPPSMGHSSTFHGWVSLRQLRLRPV